MRTEIVASRKPTTASAVCPRCGDAGKPVRQITLQSLLKPAALNGAGSGPYRFCPSERCAVVYFSEADGPMFTKDDLTVRVGIKETTAPRHVCYCFNHTIEEIEDQVRRTGKTTVLDDIKSRMKEACWCETKSPLGSCCLATVTKYVKAAQARYVSGGEQSAVEEKNEDCCTGLNLAVAAPAAAIPVVVARSSKAERMAWIGSVGSAVVASACCWLPLVLLAFGVSGVAVSATFEKYRPIFATLTFGFLGAAFYFAYRPKPKTAAATSAEGSAGCTTEPAKGDCCPPEGNRTWTLQKFNRAMLWVVTAIALAFVFFPNYVGALLSGRRDAEFGANLDPYIVAVEGMDCAGCADALEKELKAVPGVSAAKVSFERKEAVIGILKGGAAPKVEVLAAISGSGFKGRFQSLETRTIPIAGMTCEACAAHVQANLAKVPGVRSATVSYEGRKAVVVADPSVDQTALDKAVESAGHKVAQEAKPESEK